MIFNSVEPVSFPLNGRWNVSNWKSTTAVE